MSTKFREEDLYNINHFFGKSKEQREREHVDENDSGDEKYIGVGNMADWWIDKIKQLN